MRLNQKIKYYFYRSISAIVAMTIVASSFTLVGEASLLAKPLPQQQENRAASALNPPPPQGRQTSLVSSSNICPSNLSSVLDPIVNAPTFAKGKWGVLVQSLATGQTLYQHNAEQPLIPASNIKLLTTAAAVQNVPKLQPIDLEEWLRAISLVNRDSNNRQANRLLSQMGGVQAIKTAIAPLGVNPDTYKQVDGSGLSRSNRAEAMTFVNLLRGMSSTPENFIFYDSLSIAGLNGTLSNRLTDPFLQGRVHAKTGTLKGVRTLSGYLDNPNYGKMVFSIMVNQSGLSGKVMTNAIDEMVLDLAQVKNCG
ncbi:MAG: D-alanyl-D-alanine carboxypeptidase [Chamaesiphon sp.]|nr:D-alanyl-D-alanine carboxypeptidase [Chamaesiphon sp.]